MKQWKKKEFRVPIKHYYLRGKTAKEAEEKLDKYYGTSSPSNRTVKRWMQEFKFGRKSASSKPRSRRPSDAIATEMMKKILRLVTDDRKLQVCEISKIITANYYWINSMR